MSSADGHGKPPVPPASEHCIDHNSTQLAPLSQEALNHIASQDRVRKAAEDGTLKELLANDADLKAAVGGDDKAIQQTDHDTLKYHLLGPSLTKAGQDSVDQTKVSEIIYNASKGSKFFNNEEVKDRNLTEKINRILARKRQLDRLDLSTDRRKADDHIASLEMSRDLSQTIVHIDCDAFYAAVEELDHPELREVPMAVGKGVLTTCNYHARKFGCRSGMAGFVALKLCPQLICLPLNFDKYTTKAREVRTVLAKYDPRFQSASMDEAYCNLTEYCTTHSLTPDDAVAQLRAEVYTTAHITVSAGIAPNATLAKICSNRNKPNGQYRIPPDRASILAFMRDLPTRKVNGIGRVFERELEALGIKTCGDIYSHRHYLSQLFGDKAFRFLLSVHLGLGATSVRPSEESERKSVGTESTFRDMSDPAELKAKLRHIAEELEGDLARTECKGRTLVLKIKLHTYEVLTRQVAPPFAVSRADDLYRYGLPMMERLMREHEKFTLRLMGLRCTHLVSTKKGDVESFFGGGASSTGASRPDRTGGTDADGWQIWPATEFEEAAEREREEELGEAEALSQQHDKMHFAPAAAAQPSAQNPTSTTSTKNASKPALPRSNAKASGGVPRHSPSLPSTVTPSDEPQVKVDDWRCPICARLQPQLTGDNAAINAHVDLCLSRGLIQDVVARGDSAGESDGDLKDTSRDEEGDDHAGHVVSPLVCADKTRAGANGRNGLAGKKRGRPRSGGAGVTQEKKKRLFFA